MATPPLDENITSAASTSQNPSTVMTTSQMHDQKPLLTGVAPSHTRSTSTSPTASSPSPNLKPQNLHYGTLLPPTTKFHPEPMTKPPKRVHYEQGREHDEEAQVSRSIRKRIFDPTQPWYPMRIIRVLVVLAMLFVLVWLVGMGFSAAGERNHHQQHHDQHQRHRHQPGSDDLASVLGDGTGGSDKWLTFPMI